MEEVLDVYAKPYDPICPVVCLDETNRQLIEKRSIPMTPNHPELVDYEYRRCGVVDLFVAFEPLAAKRFVEITETRTRKDFALFIEKLVDVHYRHAERIVLVMDNLNTHSVASLYAAFPAVKARRLAEKLEIHHTPKHASWLNMAEIEISVLSRQCLGKPVSSIEEMRDHVNPWLASRNRQGATVHWQFTTADARVKLKRLYPVLSDS